MTTGTEAHRPVMLAEVLAQLQPAAGKRYVDGTAGWGGHAAAILRASAPDGWLFGCDRDGAAIAAAAERLAEFAGRFELRRGNYAELGDWLPRESYDGVLLDLGVSSPQVDQPERGFSFQQDGPLDMRMDQRQTTTAATLVNELSAEELAGIFWRFGEEPQARRFARALVAQRAAAPFRTTGQLAQLIERLAPRHGKRLHPATRVFQALRVAVNDELASLERGLAGAWRILRAGGVLLVITFQSLEARVVKNFARDLERPYTVTGEVDLPEFREPRAPRLRRRVRRALTPSEGEIHENPRARSAQLRVYEKLEHGA